MTKEEYQEYKKCLSDYNYWKEHYVIFSIRGLEKEIEKYFRLWRQEASDEGCVNADSQFVSIFDCHRIARHFAEWGASHTKQLSNE